MRRARVDLRVRQEEKDDWQRAAGKKGLSVSELVRQEMRPHTSRNTKALLKALEE